MGGNEKLKRRYFVRPIVEPRARPAHNRDAIQALALTQAKG
jgi:hypothetical protein